MYKIYIFLLLISVSFLGRAQDTINFVDLDQQTTQHYYASQWDSVILVGKLGLKNGHDYFYLRVRMGIAYFYQEKYTKAITQLEKARSFNDQDDFTNSYLYLSYKYSGRVADAEVLERKLSDTLRAQPLFEKTPFFSGMYTEVGYSPTTSYTPIPLAKESDYFKETSAKNNSLKYAFVGLTNQVTPWMTLFYGITSLGTSLTKYTYQKQLPPLLPKLTSTNLNIKLFQFYLNSRIRICRGLIITPFYHSISMSGSSGVTTRPRQIDTSSFKSKDAIMGVGFEKQYRNFVFSSEVSNNRFNEIKHLQLQAGITWFPYFNQNLYLYGAFTYNTTEKIDSQFPPFYEPNKLYITAKVGGKLFSKLWGETAFYGGNIQDSQIGNGYLFFSNPSSYTMVANATLNLILSKVKISLKYQYAGLKGLKESFISDSNSITSQFLFNQQTITGGLLWSF